MNVISYIAIPINLCILVFARYPKSDQVGAFQDLDTVGFEEQSSVTQFLIKRDVSMTRTNIILLAIGIEHLIIGLKIVIAILIPDVPAHVKLSEMKRPDFVQTALKAIEKQCGAVADSPKPKISEGDKGKEQDPVLNARECTTKQEVAENHNNTKM